MIKKFKNVTTIPTNLIKDTEKMCKNVNHIIYN